MKSALQFILIMAILVVAFPVTLARADIMISPIYIIFDEKARAADVMLINTTRETNVYRLSWSYSKQQEDGHYQKLDSDPNSPFNFETMVRFAPKQVTLPPQGRQKIRLQLQRPAGLPDGEYRAHLNFKLLPNDVLSKEKEPGIMKMEIKVFLGIAMPVVVRQGPYDAKATIEDVKFEKQKSDDKNPSLMVKVARSGKHGTYGRIRVFWDRGGETTQVGALNNFAIYADNNVRHGYVHLSEAAIPSGKLRIVYEGDGPQRGQVFAERAVNIGR